MGRYAAGLTTRLQDLLDHRSLGVQHAAIKALVSVNKEADEPTLSGLRAKFADKLRRILDERLASPENTPSDEHLVLLLASAVGALAGPEAAHLLARLLGEGKTPKERKAARRLLETPRNGRDQGEAGSAREGAAPSRANRSGETG
ncbi:MAG: hypothetical protein AB1486_28760 [Planctomycetota bacterium]